MDLFPKVLPTEIRKAGEENKAIIAIIHDDGYPETGLFLAELLDKHDLIASVALIANKIGTPGEDPTDIHAVTSDKGQDELYWFWSELFKKQPGRLSLLAHTHTHHDTGLSEEAIAREIIGAQTVLRARFPGERVLTYAGAGFGVHEGSSYSRKDLSIAEAPYVRRTYIAERIGTCGTYNKYTELDRYAVKCCSLYTDLERKHSDVYLKRALEEAKDCSEGGLLVLFFHGITPLEQEDRFIHVSKAYADEVFEHISENYVKPGIYRNMTFENAMQYVLEYNNAALSAVAEEDKITVRLGCALVDDRFDYPLDIRIYVTDLGEHDYFIRDEKQTVKTDADGKQYLALKMVPNRENLIVNIK